MSKISITGWLRGKFKTPSKKGIRGNNRFSRIYSFENNTIANNETIFAAVTMLSNALASSPLNLRKDYEKVKSKDKDFARLLRDGPNPNQTTFEFIRLMETLRNVKGNAYAIKEYDRYGGVNALWMLDNSVVTPFIEEQSKELWYRVAMEDGNRYIHNSHIFSVSHIGTGNLKGIGISPIDVLRNTLSYDKNVKELSLEQLEKGVNFRYCFSLDSAIDPKKLNEYHEEVIEKFKNKGVIYLDKGKELKELTNNSFIDPKIFEVEEITVTRVARVFNIPPQKLYSGKQTYSSNEQGDLEFLVDTVLPIVRMYEQEFNKKCLLESERDEGYEVKFNLNGYARADMKTRSEFYFKGIRSGWFTPNDIRIMEDMPKNKLPEADMLYVSRDLIPIDKLDMLLKSKKK